MGDEDCTQHYNNYNGQGGRILVEIAMVKLSWAEVTAAQVKVKIKEAERALEEPKLSPANMEEDDGAHAINKKMLFL